MRKQNSIFRTKFVSESGSHISNGDYFTFVELKDYACYCIADDIDDDMMRESAKIAVTAAVRLFRKNPGCSRRLAKHYMQGAHNELLRESEETSLKVNMVILLTDYKRVLWISAGDTRLVGIRNKSIKWKTKDTMCCYLGQTEKFKPVTYRKRNLKHGDIIILYTRGAWRSIEDTQLLDVVEKAKEPEALCTRLEDEVLDDQQYMVDNYTIVAIFVDDGTADIESEE